MLSVLTVQNLGAQQATCDYPSSASGAFSPGVGLFFGSEVQNPNAAIDTDYSSTYTNFYQGFGGGFFSRHTLTVNLNGNGKSTDQIWIKAGLSSSIFSANVFSGFNIKYYFTDGTTSVASIGGSFASWGINVGGTGVENGVYLPAPGKQFNKVEIYYESPAAVSITGDLAHIYGVKRVPAQPAAPGVSGVNTTISSCAPTSSATTFNITNPLPELTYKWYSSATGGTPIFTGTSFSPAPSTQVGSTNYYVEATVANNCPAPTIRTSASRTQVQRTVTACDLNADADGDGIKNGDEGYDPTNPRDTDGDGIPDYLDKDSDNDGIPDSVEKGSSATGVDTDGDTIPDYRDLDSDNDGINDVREGGGSATDNDNDGRADGTVDPNTGIPSSAGSNGTTTPRDTDGDGKPDYKDLDSDNDGKSDLVENGNPAATAGDTNNDGVIDYSSANDPDKDGIMSPADGIPTTWGDANDPNSKNTGPNTSDAPDYINPKSDGTNNDINSTPYKGQDANGDGKIDNTTDPDNDGIPNVIDTKPSDFGGLPAYDPNGDADGDGIKNGDEGGPNTDTDGDGKPDYLDKDSDNDGIPDSVEKGTGTTPVDTDGDTIPDYRDLDSDNDGINDVREGGGTATDTNNDGRADGTVDPNTGIPSSAGSNGTTTPRDTDGDGKPDYKDLDSDNDSIGDLQESGNPTAIAGDVDKDGVIDYSPANDPDKDGIMSPADGLPTTWGDGSDATPKNTGPNTSDAPDYINPKSDGTNNDINSTPNGGLDGNGDGKIDNTTDPDGDGIANVIDKKPTEFGGIDPVAPPAADLRPLIVMSDVGFIKPASLSKPAELRLYNVGASNSTATGPITVYIYPPNNKFSLSLVNSPGWNLVYTAAGNYYTLTSDSKTIPYGNAGFQKVNFSVTAAPDVSKGKYSIQFEIGDGSGGETNNLNNSVSVEIGVSGN